MRLFVACDYVIQTVHKNMVPVT